MSTPLLPQARVRPRFRIFGLVVTVFAAIGTIVSSVSFVFGVHAAFTDETGLGAIWLFLGAGYLVFLVPALYFGVIGTRRDHFEALVVGLVLLVCTVLGAPLLLMFGLFSMLPE